MCCRLQQTTLLLRINEAKLIATIINRNLKSESIHFRVALGEKEIIERAVLVSGQTLTDFATRSLLDSANKILERGQVTTLSNRDRDRLLAMLDDEEPNEVLRQATEIHRQIIAE